MSVCWWVGGVCTCACVCVCVRDVLDVRFQRPMDLYVDIICTYCGYRYQFYENVDADAGIKI